MSRPEVGYPTEHSGPAGSPEPGRLYGRYDEATCGGRIQAVYARFGSSAKWTRVGSLCVRCAVYWPNVEVLESIDPPGRSSWYRRDPGSDAIRKLGAVDRRPSTARSSELSTAGDGHVEPSTAVVDDDRLQAADPDTVDGGGRLLPPVDGGEDPGRLQPDAGDEPSTASVDGEPSTGPAIAATVDAPATSPNRRRRELVDAGGR